MRLSTVRRLLGLATLVLLSASFALAQRAQPAPNERPAASSLVDSLHYDQPRFTDWNSLAGLNPRNTVFVVTRANPTHRRTCRIQSFGADHLLCKGFAATQSYKVQDIAALIVPGEYGFKLRALLVLNSAIGASIWATVILAATCPACAVGTGIAAFLFFSAAGAIAIGDDQPDALLYLAPGQKLQVELRY